MKIDDYAFKSDTAKTTSYDIHDRYDRLRAGLGKANQLLYIKKYFWMEIILMTQNAEPMILYRMQKNTCDPHHQPQLVEQWPFMASWALCPLFWENCMNPKGLQTSGWPETNFQTVTQ